MTNASSPVIATSFTKQLCKGASLLLWLSLTACTSHQGPHPSKNMVAPLQQAIEVVLTAQMVETSALACLEDGSFLTINDSGHTPTVYQINHQGQLLQQYELNASNRDWEAMAIHQGQLWIADIGNNSGKNPGGDLYQLNLPLRLGQNIVPSHSSFIYPDFPQLPLTAYQHDFDAEALVSANGQLFLINKAWQSDHSSVYLLEPNNQAAQQTLKTTHQARMVATISGLPGVITDAAFSQQHQRFVLTGYARFRDNALRLALNNDYQPFLAVIDQHFQLQQLVPIPQSGQLEAICIDPQQQVWLTQEQSKRRPALLWRWGTMDKLLSLIDID